MQFWLRLAADNYSALRTVTVDGSYGAATVSAVEAFQTLFGLTSDGVVGRSTWNKLKEVGLAVANKIVAANVAPGQFDHHAGGQQRHRRAGRAILPAAAGGLLQRCAARGRGRKIRCGDDAGR